MILHALATLTTLAARLAILAAILSTIGKAIGA